MKQTFAIFAVLPLLASAALAAGPVENEPARINELKQQDPFEVVDQLHEYTYADLREMYPNLSDALMQSLMIRIVDSMKETPPPSSN